MPESETSETLLFYSNFRRIGYEMILCERLITIFRTELMGKIYRQVFVNVAYEMFTKKRSCHFCMNAVKSSQCGSLWLCVA